MTPQSFQQVGETSESAPPHTDVEQPCRVFIVDKQPVFRLGLCQLINSADDMTICGEAEQPKLALANILQQRPSVVVAAISLQGGNGLDLIKQLRLHPPAPPVMVLSRHDEALFAERAMRAGAAGYMMKNATPEQITDAIRRVAQGEIVVSEKLAHSMLRRVFHGTPSTTSSILNALSDREVEVFELIGRGYSTREIASALSISVKTVETHQAHVKQKLNLRGYKDLLRAALGWVAGISTTDN